MLDLVLNDSRFRGRKVGCQVIGPKLGTSHSELFGSETSAQNWARLAVGSRPFKRTSFIQARTSRYTLRAIIAPPIGDRWRAHTWHWHAKMTSFKNFTPGGWPWKGGGKIPPPLLLPKHLGERIVTPGRSERPISFCYPSRG